MSHGEEKDKGLEEIKRIFHERFGDPSAGDKRGVFGFEAKAQEQARKIERDLLEEEIASCDRGYEGNTRTCPKCGEKRQRYKGDRHRQLRFECGELKISRAYYVCDNCGESSIPLDEKLGLAEGKEQGRLREKLSLLATLTPYHQAPEVSRIFFDTECHSNTLRRLLLREAEHYETLSAETTLEVAEDDTVYIQIDGHMCPTREKRRDDNDQGYREAKLAIAFSDKDIAQISKDRTELLKLVLQGRIASAESFLEDVQDVYQRANADKAGRVVAIADGAKWIWNTIEEVAPEAIQILDYAHAKGYLYDAAKIIFSSESTLVKPWVKQQQDLLFENNIARVIENIRAHAEQKPDLKSIETYFRNNQQRILYGAYQSQGLLIGSGAIESAGKRISQGRIKGCGMRWNVNDVNKLIALRCAFYDNSWGKYWKQQHKIAA